MQRDRMVGDRRGGRRGVREQRSEQTEKNIQVHDLERLCARWIRQKKKSKKSLVDQGDEVLLSQCLVRPQRYTEDEE